MCCQWDPRRTVSVRGKCAVSAPSVRGKCAASTGLPIFRQAKVDRNEAKVIRYSQQEALAPGERSPSGTGISPRCTSGGRAGPSLCAALSSTARFGPARQTPTCPQEFRDAAVPPQLIHAFVHPRSAIRPTAPSILRPKFLRGSPRRSFPTSAHARSAPEYPVL